MEKISSNPVVEINVEDSCDYKSLSSYLSSLDLIRGLNAQHILPAHGLPFANHRKRVDELRNHHLRRKKEVLDILGNASRFGANDGVTLFMISSRLFSSIFGVGIFLGISEAKGHLEILEEEGIITSCLAGARYFYPLHRDPIDENDIRISRI